MVILRVCRLVLLLLVSPALLYGYMVEEFRLIKAIPKIELHAHLHGSIRMSTLQELSGSSGLPLNVDSELNLEKCFKLFGLVHKLVSNIGVVKRILKEVIDDYMAENTIYLELRTTPRSLSDGTTVEAYVETLVDLVQQHNIQFGDKMLVKLVLSIDRSSRFKDAIEISELAADYRFLSNSTEYPVRTIVGLDFSGNPYGGKFEDFSPLFDNAKERGLGLTVHTAEVRELSDSVDPRTDEDDTESILNFRPDRLGHVLYLQQHHLDQMLELLAKKEAIPIEVCPTSNKITLGHAAYAEHPYLSQWIARGYPVSINTDDRGIFNTTLTEELLSVKDALRLDLADIVRIVGSTIDQSFASEGEKQRLQSQFWGGVQEIVKSQTDAGSPFALLKPTKATAGKVQNAKDIQDMAYLLYI